MARKVSAGVYQIGIYEVMRVKGEHRAVQWTAQAQGPGTIGSGYVGSFPTLGAAYKQLTGERMPGRSQ